MDFWLPFRKWDTGEILQIMYVTVNTRWVVILVSLANSVLRIEALRLASEI